MSNAWGLVTTQRLLRLRFAMPGVVLVDIGTKIQRHTQDLREAARQEMARLRLREHHGLTPDFSELAQGTVRVLAAVSNTQQRVAPLA